MPNIKINGYEFDPVAERPSMAAFGLDTTETSWTNYILVQVKGPLSKDHRQQLADLGVEILAYEPTETYLARYPNDDLTSVAGLPFVLAAIPYPTFVKVPRDILDDELGAPRAGIFSDAAAEIVNSDSYREVDIVLHPGVDPASVKTTVADIAGLDPAEVDLSRNKIRATVSTERLHELSTIDEVRRIETVHRPTLLNDVATGIINADKLHLSSPPLRGSGQVIAVCDTGFDIGSSDDVHPAFTARVRKVRALGGVNPHDLNGHGTHVAGSILGDGVANGYGPVIGSAPAAELVMQAAGSAPDKELNGLPSDLYGLLKTTYDEDGARVHNNSWGVTGSSERGRYSQGATEIDEFIRDHRDMVVCFAAGNEGRDANSNGVIDNGSVTPPGTAKNCITVGSSESLRPDQSRRWATGSWTTKYPAEPISSDLWADNPAGMAAFSGRGPTRDGRTKPDLVAPGTSILSAHSRKARTRTFASLASTLTFWGTSTDPDYRYMGGTSMACPLVAGAAALVREHLISKKGIASPSAALVKACLINGCVDLVGQYVPSEAGGSPNFSSGYGRVDVRRSVSVSTDSDGLRFIDEGRELSTADEESFEIDIAEPGHDLKVTLVWTDRPGSELVNDLDLIVIAPDGSERHGNMPAGSSSFDRTNNVEQVWWRNAPVGRYDIMVRGTNVREPAQDFALVWRVDQPA